jgi:hypothetical protein
MHCIDIVHLDFDGIARCTNEQLYEHMLFACRSTKRRLIPKRIRWNAYRVTRNANSVTIHLLAATDRVAEPREVARFGFIRGPDFSGMSR